MCIFSLPKVLLYKNILCVCVCVCAFKAVSMKKMVLIHF